MFVDFWSAGGVVVVGFIEAGSLAQFDSCSCFWLLTPVGKTFKEKKLTKQKMMYNEVKNEPSEKQVNSKFTNWFLLLSKLSDH